MVDRNDTANQHNSVIFARPRLGLAPYNDLWSLITLSGYPLIYIDEIPARGVRDTTFIYSPILGDWDIGPIVTDGRVIAWDLEYRRSPYPPMPWVSEFWHMDAAQARMLGCKYVPVGSHPNFHQLDLHYHQPTARHLYDVAYIGYMGPPRRQQVAHQLDNLGVKRTPEHAYGDERDQMLRTSRLYLHAHQHDDVAAVPGLRMAVAAAYSLPVVTEACTDLGVFAGHVLTADDGHLADFTAMWARERHTQVLDEKARGLHQLLCEEWTFHRVIEATV